MKEIKRCLQFFAGIAERIYLTLAFQIFSASGRLPSAIRKAFLYFLLFSVPFILRLSYAFYFCPIVLVPDEFLYPHCGKLYINGMLTGDFSVFAVNSEHPPLSKLLTGVFVLTFTRVGLTEIQSLRLQDSLFGALTCILVYFFGLKLNHKVGWLSWLFLTFDWASIKDVIASLDVTCLFFLTLSIFYLFDFFNEREYSQLLLSGIFFGLAFLSKYVALPIFLGAYLLWLAYRKIPIRDGIRNLLFLLVVGSVVLIAGNPLLWSAKGWTVAYNRQVEMGHGATFLGFMLDSFAQRKLVMVAIWNFSLSLFALMLFPLGRILDSFLIWVMFALFVFTAYKRRSFQGEEMLFFLWFASGFVFYWFLAKQLFYYVIVFYPPLALYCSLAIVNIWREKR
ncbi:glycosyltransferase family 39 protein [Candidatus Bathyarchaeota archaeon]|nr:glycosyltransferase family 39 protein [Candidatus Bathyarchaeota archaeon]